MQRVQGDEIFIQAAKGYKIMWPMRAQVIPCAKLVGCNSQLDSRSEHQEDSHEGWLWNRYPARGHQLLHIIKL
jgi:hypothetical protein